MPENFEKRPVPDEWSERQKKIRRLLDEFRAELTKQDYMPEIATDGVVVLSAPFIKEGDTIIEKSPENIARIQYGIDVIHDIVSSKIGKPREELTEEDIVREAPPLVLNGETEQLPAMEEAAKDLGFPEEKILTVNCGDRGVGNTRTQFEIMNDDARFEHDDFQTYITSSYHAPRVARTADKNLDPEMKFEVIGVPYEDFSYDVFKKIRGEVKRILAYSEKGDISAFRKEEDGEI